MDEEKKQTNPDVSENDTAKTDDNTEQETVKEETAAETKQEESKEDAAGTPNAPQNKKGNSPLIWVAAILVVAVLMMFFFKNSQSSSGCTVVPQSAFGQSQEQTWTELEGASSAEAIAKFSLTLPEENLGYTDLHYMVYTQQIYEVQYENADGDEGMRIAKGIMCGSPVFEVTEKTYKSTNIVEVNGNEVTEYGDGTYVSVASWTEDKYSYFIGIWDQQLTQEEMEALIVQIH